MSDFDERLSAVLTTEADGAPLGAGLAQAARRRHVVRRRRRIAAGGVAAALAIAAPVVVLAGGDGGDDNLDVSDQTSARPGWQTVAQDDVRAEIPGDWSKFTCDFDGFTSDVFGPSESDACEFHTYLAFYASATFDPLNGPGVITEGNENDSGGYVYAGDLAVSAGTDDLDLTRRILASARVDGEPEVDAAEWRTVEGVGIRVDLPVSWGLGPGVDLRDFAVCVAPGERNDPPVIDRKGNADEISVAWAWVDGRWVTVSAPTDAVRDLVMATVEGSPDSSGVGCLSDVPGNGAPSGDWQQFDAQGVRFELPTGWAQLDCPSSANLFGPSPGLCGRGEYLTLYAEALFDPAMAPGKVISDEEEGETLWTGYVFAGDWAVFVRTHEQQLTEDILATVRQ